LGRATSPTPTLSGRMKRQYQNTSNKSLVLPSPHGGTVVINRGATILLDDYYDRFVPQYLSITSMNAFERPRVMLKSRVGAVALRNGARGTLKKDESETRPTTANTPNSQSEDATEEAVAAPPAPMQTEQPKTLEAPQEEQEPSKGKRKRRRKKRDKQEG